MLDSPPLRRAAAVVRNRRDVLDERDFEAGSLQRADRGFASRAWGLAVGLGGLHPVIHRLARHGFGSHLGGERRRFLRALEAEIAGRGPSDDAALVVGDGHDRVVKGRVDVGDAERDVLELALLARLGLFLGSQTCSEVYPSPTQRAWGVVASTGPASGATRSCYRTSGEVVRPRGCLGQPTTDCTLRPGLGQ